MEKKLKKMVRVESDFQIWFEPYHAHRIEEEALGSLYNVTDSTYILSYETFIEKHDTVLDKTIVTIKLHKGVLTIVRIGNQHARMTFIENEWSQVQFFYGGKMLDFRVFTKKLDYAMLPEGGTIELLYEMWSGDVHLGYYSLFLFVS